LLHELTHSTGHKSRLDRDLTGKFGSESYSKEECIAELGSLFLMAHLKIEGETKNSEAYIKGWLLKGLKQDPKMLWKLASEAQKAFNFLLSVQKEEDKAA
jgi:antirestriction protein ArdC